MDGQRLGKAAPGWGFRDATTSGGTYGPAHAPGRYRPVRLTPGYRRVNLWCEDQSKPHESTQRPRHCRAQHIISPRTSRRCQDGVNSGDATGGRLGGHGALPWCWGWWAGQALPVPDRVGMSNGRAQGPARTAGWRGCRGRLPWRPIRRGGTGMLHIAAALGMVGRCWAGQALPVPDRVGMCGGRAQGPPVRGDGGVVEAAPRGGPPRRRRWGWWTGQAPAVLDRVGTRWRMMGGHGGPPVQRHERFVVGHAWSSRRPR